MFAPFIAMRSALRRLGRARRGSTTVEFALVVFPFFLLTFGLAEIAMIGFAQTSLNYAVSETSRQIRTGQAQLGGITEAQIKALEKYLVGTSPFDLERQRFAIALPMAAISTRCMAMSPASLSCKVKSSHAANKSPACSTKATLVAPRACTHHGTRTCTSRCAISWMAPTST